LDQVAALHWIQENIRPFGGNPRDVTLLGHGVGAALVNLLMTSPVTAGQQCIIINLCLHVFSQFCAFSALTLLVDGRQEEHPACN